MLADGHHLSISYLAYFLSVITNTFGHMCLYCAVGEILAAQVIYHSNNLTFFNFYHTHIYYMYTIIGNYLH